jgi:hypothetical protein
MKQTALLIIGLMFWGLSLGQTLEATFVGKLEGSKAFIAVVVSGGKTLAYVCDSEKLAQWFRGPVVDGTVEVKTANGEHLQVRLSPQGATGSLVWGGQLYAFSAAPAEGTAGLYRVEASANQTAYIGGWIVNQQGEQRGAIIGGGSLAAAVMIVDACDSLVPAVGALKPWLVAHTGRRSEKCEVKQL